MRVLVADDEPALRGALSELLGQEEHVELVGTAADADEAIALALRELPDVALVDVKMPAGGGPRAAREIQRLSPTTRVIALSAFEDRPTVLEMLRAGAVGYLVKGTAAEEIVWSIRRVAGGGTSLSAEVIGGIVHELSSQLRREEIEEESRRARREEIERFVAGEGLSMAFQPIVDLTTRERVGFEALARFRSIPLRAPDEWFAEAVALELGARLELATIGRSLAALDELDPELYLSVNCSHRVAVSESSRDRPGARRVAGRRGDHRARARGGLRRALRGARAPAGPRRADRDRRRGGRVREPQAHAAHRAGHREGRHLAGARHRPRPRPARPRLGVDLLRRGDGGSTIVAEGIETAGELRTLVELGVGFGQGYHLAEPGPLPA